MKKITLLFIISLFINGMFGDEVSVTEGDSVTLHTNDAGIQAANDASVIWTYQKTRIARINRAANKISIHDDVLDGRFKDRLKMNNQTGDLTITNIKTTDSGLYEVDITFGKKNIPKSFDVKCVINPESDQLKSVSVKAGDSVTLHTDVDFKTYDEIEWRFQGIRIAQFDKSASNISENDEIQDKRFRDKLQLDVKTGSLKIKNIRTDLSGLYEVEISSSSNTILQSLTVTVSGEVKSVSVMMGDPLTINTDVPDIKTYDQILLIFGCDDRIAEVNKKNKKFTLDKRFREGLTLNDQTGDFTIKVIRIEDAGDYELKMSSRRRTIQRRFSVSVSEPGLSPGAKAVIYILISVIILLLIAAAAAAVVIYDHRNDETLKVDERKSVDLKAEVTDIQGDEKKEWTFKPGEPTSKIWEMFIDAMKRLLGFSRLNETLVAEINPANSIFRTYDGDDDLFKDKLKLNDQTGDLTINDIRQKHTGVYKLKIIRGGKTTEKRFIVFVRGNVERLLVYEEKSVTLETEVKDIKRDDLIEWRFRETLIAKIHPVNKIFSTYDGDDDLFRDKLKLNPQTGDLTISDFREKHKGGYRLKITRDGETSYKRFSVCLGASLVEVDEGKSVDLRTKVTDIQTDDVIEWTYQSEDCVIAKINPANNIFSTSDGDDDRFRDKLKLNPQTGDLTISDFREKHYGFYKLKITRGGKTLRRILMVSIRRETAGKLYTTEGASVDLDTYLNDIKRVEKIEWRFNETLIAEINPANKTFSIYDDDYDLFRGKLKLNKRTGDLTIKKIRDEHEGLYEVKIIRDGESSYRRTIVFISGKKLEVYEGESVDLKTKVKDIQRDDVIEWIFNGNLIAKINPANNIVSAHEGHDDLFRDNLELNPQTGDLNINDIRQKHAGVYGLEIIRDGENSHRFFTVSVKAPRGEDPVRKRNQQLVV